MGTNYTMKIAGNAVNVESGTLDVINQIGQRSTGTVTVWSNPGVKWSRGTRVQVFDQNNSLVYSGYTTKDKVLKSSRQGHGYLEHQLTLMDNCYRADKRLIFEQFLNVSAGTIVRSILTNVLAAEGVTATATSIASGATITAVVWNGKQVSAALTWLATASGYWWNIDTAGVLWFQPYTGIPAPFVLDGTTVNIDNNLSVTYGNDLYVNRQYVKGAFAETGILTESQHGDGSKRGFTLSYEIASSAARDLSIAVNGIGQSIGTKGDTGDQWYVAIGDSVVAQDTSQTVLGSGDTLTVTYKGRFPILALAQNGALIAGQKAIEGVGTGYVESEYSNTKIYTQAAAFQQASALLGHYGSDVTQLEFDMLASQGAGLMEGQVLTVNLSDFSLSGAQMLVSSVEITDAINDNWNIWYHVIAIGSPYEAVQWQTYWQNLQNQIADPTDLSDVDDASGLALLLTTNDTIHPTVVGYITATTCALMPFTVPFPVC